MTNPEGALPMKKSKTLTKLAYMGLASGLVAACGTNEGHDHPNGSHNEEAALMTEAELLSKLNARSRALYDSMDEEGKDLARQIASHSCKGQNACKGLNTCKSEQNACAGKGGCGGESTCKAEPDLAVKIAAQHMAEQREEALDQPSSDSWKRDNSHRKSTTWNTSWKDK